VAENTYLLGVDVGTTGAKAVVTTARGKIVAQHTSEYGFLSPRPLWAEQWPRVWLEGLSGAVRGVVQKSGVAPQQVQGMAVSSLYGGSGIPVDARIEPLRPCLIWLDRRAQAETDWVRKALPLDELYAVTGNGVDSYYGFTKILWIKNHEPELWQRTRYLLPPNAFLIHRLTGEIAVDYSSAGNIGGVFDLRRRRWSETTTQALGIPRDKLPDRLVASSDVVGKLHRAGAELTGLLEGTPVCAGGVDAAVATLSAGVFRGGQHVAMMGTSMCWGFIHEQAPREPGFVSMPYVLHPERSTYTFGGASTAGAVVKWFRDELGHVEQAIEGWTTGGIDLTAYGLLDAAAAKVPAGSDGLLVLPYFMGERSPIWDAKARGTVIGLTLFHTRAHLYRAFLEGVAYALRHNVEAGERAGYALDPDLAIVGGGARSELWSRIMANVTGRTVLAATAGGEAALGDAMLAAVGLGVAKEEQLVDWVGTSDLYRRYAPSASETAVYDRYFEQYLGLYTDLKSRFAALAALANPT
jgi:sugar (pentulose or hexulose) kinase